MPRKPREFVDGGIYHVFNRGNNRRRLFKSEEDFHCFLKILKKAQTQYPVKLFHYCLMNNHYHLLVQNVKKTALPKFMHWLQLAYVRFFKKKYQTTGHLFEERFRGPRIAEESYYLQCGRYIERNPVEAGLVSRAEEYPYSSAPYYGQGIKNDLITPDPYYVEMGRSDAERQKNYLRFLSLADPYSAMIQNQLMKY